MLAALSLIAAYQGAEVDPNQLAIGRKGFVTVQPDTLVETKDGKAATLQDVVAAAKGKRFVYLGENHATAPHQQFHADVIKALADSGRHVVVGLEMFTRPKQDVLDLWSSGTLAEEDFLAASEWKTQWGYPYRYYKPIFDIVKDKKIPLVALNVPREWVRAVAKGGFAGLPTTAKLQLPPAMSLDQKGHREVFNAMMGGHPMSGDMGEKMYAAQVLWDESMADTALKFLEREVTDKDTVFVVCAGSGHVMYGQGINLRVSRRKGGDGITVVMIQSDEPAKVSKGIADFVYVTKKPLEQ